MIEYIAPTVISALVNVGVWIVLQRSVERRDRELDRLGREITDLRDQRIVRIEGDQKACAGSRKQIYEYIAEIRQKFVHKEECQQNREHMMQQQLRFTDAVLKLERVGEQVAQTMERTAEICQQVVHVQTDVSALAARVEDMRDKRRAG